MSPVHRLPSARSTCMLSAMLLLMTAGAARADAPTRLRLTIDPPAVTLGATARVHVEVLSRDFSPVSNDRDRIVRFEILTTGGKTQGSGTIAPSDMTLRAGASGHVTVNFIAKAPGTVRIRASSDGLAAAEALVTVVSKSSALPSWILPVAYAQQGPSFELLPTEASVPFNGLSTVELWVALSETPAPATGVWRITTTAKRAPRIRYQDQQANGFITVRVDGDTQSKAITVEPLAMGDFEVIARRLSDGSEARVPIQVVAPTARKVSLTSGTVTLAPDQDLVALKVGLVDADGVPLAALARQHEIELRSATTAWSLAPLRLTLGPDKPADNRKLTRPIRVLGATLNLIATDMAGTLDAGAITIDVTPFRSALFLLAIFGGLLGGLTRHVYRERSAYLWVRRVKDRWTPGLMLNASFGGLFGLILFQTADLGMHTVALNLEHAEIRCAFVLGVAGGFAGVLVVETLAKSVLTSMKRALPSS